MLFLIAFPKLLLSGHELLSVSLVDVIDRLTVFFLEHSDLLVILRKLSSKLSDHLALVVVLSLLGFFETLPEHLEPSEGL